MGHALGLNHANVPEDIMFNAGERSAGSPEWFKRVVCSKNLDVEALTAEVPIFSVEELKELPCKK